MKYLYYIENYSGDVRRVKVTKETDSFIWIKINDTCEWKISKKTYRTGSGYDSTYYYEENPDLLSRYNETIIKYKFLKKLEEFKKCTDIEIMKELINFKCGETK